MQDADLLVEVNGVPHRVSRDEGGLVRAHAPAVVVAIPVSEGDEVQAGDVVAVTEAMKMEASLTSPVHGRVRQVLVAPNMHVPAGRPLVQIDAIEDERGGGDDDARRVAFEASGDDGPSDLRAPALARARLRRRRGRRRGDRAPAGRAPVDAEGERALLEAYADVRALDRPHADDEGLGSPQERLHAFLRSLDPAAEGLPDRFVAALERALAHYGVEGLERTAGAGGRVLPAVRQPAARAPAARRAVQAVLARHLERRATTARTGPTTATARCSTGSRTRSPRASPRWPSWRASCAGRRSTARSSRRRATETYAEMDEHLRALAATPAGATRSASATCTRSSAASSRSPRCSRATAPTPRRPRARRSSRR